MPSRDDRKRLEDSARNKSGPALLLFHVKGHEAREEAQRNGDAGEAHLLKIRQAAFLALKEIDRLRSAGPTMRQEVFDAEVERISQSKLHAYGCELVVQHVGDGTSRLMIKVRKGKVRYDLIENFFHRDNN